MVNDDIETGDGRVPGTKARLRRVLSQGAACCCPGGVRCKGGVSSSQALAWNRRTCRLDTDGQSKWVRSAPWSQEGEPQAEEHREGQSTDAGHRGGPARSSDEGPVMGLERRGRAGQDRSTVNPAGEEPVGGPKPKVKSFDIRQAPDLRGVGEGPGQQRGAGRGRRQHRRVRRAARGTTSTSCGTG